MSGTAPIPSPRGGAVGRRRGAPRSRVVRRFLAAALAATAVLLALRDRPVPATGAERPPAAAVSTIPLVLPVDAATATVLRPGQAVDLYAATGEQPPALTASGLPLIDVRPPAGGHDSTTRPAYVVVGIPRGDTQLIGTLLAAEAIVATVSAAHP